MSKSTGRARIVICAEPLGDHTQRLLQLGVSPDAEAITHGILIASDDMEWVGVDPLPAGQAFNLRSWDGPADDREPGWHTFRPWVANALNLAALRIEAS